MTNNVYSDLVKKASALSASQGANEISNIIEFIESPWGLHPMKLFDVQRVILKGHYGIELDNTERFRVDVERLRKKHFMFTEKEYLEYLFEEGRSNIKEVIPGKERRQLILCCGRRSGKTTITAAIGAYEVYKLLKKEDPHKYYGLPYSNKIQLTAIATGKEQASILYSEASEHFNSCGYFIPYKAKNTMTYAMFQTPRDIKKYGSFSKNADAQMSIKFVFRPCKAKGLRGHGNILVVLDEAAHFNDVGQASADDVYNAVAPSMAAFSPKDPNDRRKPIGPVESRLVELSSPLGKSGHFYKMYQMGFSGDPMITENMFCVQAPTWEVNPTIEPSFLEQEFRKDANQFFTEFGAIFSDRSRGWIESAEDLDACIIDDKLPQTTGNPRITYFCGLDLALKNDASAIAIGHTENGKVILDVIDSICAGVGKFEHHSRLGLEDVAGWIADYARKFRIHKGMLDQHSGFAFEDALRKKGLDQFEATHMTRTLISDIFKNFKQLMYDERLVLYNYPLKEQERYCPYLAELLELQQTQHSKHLITVEASQSRFKKDDLSDALVRMVYLASHNLSKNTSKDKFENIGNPLVQEMQRIHREQMLNQARSGISSRTMRPSKRGKFR